MELTLDLVIPLYNEEGNVPTLLRRIADSGLTHEGLRRVLLINNGSQDKTAEQLTKFSGVDDCFHPIHLSSNLGYGGGVHHGLQRTEAPFVGYMPGDNQISIDDLATLWRTVRQLGRHEAVEHTVFKGFRTVRHDPLSTRFVSYWYTMLVNAALGIGVRDVNGLPKIFHRSLLDHLPERPYSTFTFDAQLLAAAKCAGYSFHEVPVVFHSRRAGVSSWSQKRLKVYWETALQIRAVRREMRKQTLQRSTRVSTYSRSDARACPHVRPTSTPAAVGPE